MTLEWYGDDGYSAVFDGSTGVAVGNDVQGVDAPPVDLFMSSLVTSDGAVLVKQRKPVRRVLLPLLFIETLSGGARSEMHALLRSMVTGGTLRYSGANIRDLLSVRYESGAEQGSTGRDAGSFNEEVYTISILALDPWWYGQSSVDLLSFAAAVSFDNAGTVFDAVIGFDGSDANPVTVGGDAAASPITTIVGPFTTLQVGIAGGQTFQLAAALAAGDTIVVDSSPGNRGPRRNGGAIDWSLLTAASRLWELPVGNSVLNAAATGDDAFSLVEVAWRERWLTP